MDTEKRQRALKAEAEHFRGVNKNGSLRLAPVAKIARIANVSRPTLYAWRKNQDYLKAIVSLVSNRVTAALDKSDQPIASTPKISEAEIHAWARANFKVGTTLQGESKRYRDAPTFANAIIAKGLVPADLVEAKRRKQGTVKP